MCPSTGRLCRRRSDMRYEKLSRYIETARQSSMGVLAVCNDCAEDLYWGEAEAEVGRRRWAGGSEAVYAARRPGRYESAGDE